MYIRIIEKAAKKSESLGNYSEDIDIDANDLRQVHQKVEEVWQRATKIDKDEAGYCIYGEKDLPLVRGDLHAVEGRLASIETVPICAACGQDLKTHGQFARNYRSTESEESRRKIFYACMNEECKKYGINLELMALLSA